MINRVSVLLVQNWGSSGSTLLQSLLDGHPSLLNTPALSMKDFFYWWEGVAHMPQERRVIQFHTVFRWLFDSEHVDRSLALHQLGENMNEASVVDEQLFKQYFAEFWRQAAGSERKRFFLAVYFAYAKALGREVAPQYIVFPIHANPKRQAQYLREDFPDALFLYTVRNPLTTVNSMIKHVRNYHYKGRWWRLNAAECVLAGLFNDFTIQSGRYTCFGESPYFEDMYYSCAGIRLEDLHERPRLVMESICGWANIPWNDCLLRSTYDGKTWWNRLESPRSAGTDKELAEKKVTSLTDSDIRRLSELGANKFRRWSYPMSSITSAERLKNVLSIPLPFSFEDCRPSLLKGYDKLSELTERLDLVKLSRLFSALLEIRELQEQAPEIPSTAAELCKRYTINGSVSSSVVFVAQSLGYLVGTVYAVREYVRNRVWILAAYRRQFSGPLAVALLPLHGLATAPHPSSVEPISAGEGPAGKPLTV